MQQASIDYCYEGEGVISPPEQQLIDFYDCSEITRKRIYTT